MSYYEAMFLFLNAFVLWVETALSALYIWVALPQPRGIRQIAVLQSSLIIEFVLAALLACLVFEPLGSLELISCGMDRVSDWYPALYNPVLRHGNSLHCVNEAAYPLITWVLVFDSFVLLLCLTVRPLLHAFVPASARAPGS